MKQNSNHNKAFARLIRRMGYNQKQFAEAMGVNPQTLNGWLMNRYKPTPFHLAKMAATFTIDFEELETIFFGDSEQ